jgi:hypothetical protein
MSHTKLNNPQIPTGLKPFFQEYDYSNLDINNHANLIVGRTLEYGTWEEVQWLFNVYGLDRIRSYVRQYGERGLNPVTFNYWRKLLKIRRWHRSPFPINKGELWNP